jgi:predicted nicotinamide N-methyase
MTGYRTRQEQVAVCGAPELAIRALLDRQQFCDPHGVAERLGISAAAWPLFGQLWPSAVRLAERIAARPVRAGERILEIGCGLALPSLVGHRRGADMTASDCHPLARGFLRENLRLNALGAMKYRHGSWASLPTTADVPPAPRLRGRFDLVIGSDLLYERDDRALLPAFIARFARTMAEVWIVDPDRGNRPAFNRQMAGHGFGVREQRLDCAASGSTAAYKGRLLVYRRQSAALSPA